MSKNMSLHKPHKPRIVVVTVGDAATQALRDLIPKMPDTEFIAYISSNEPVPEQPAYDRVINNQLKYRLFPRQNCSRKNSQKKCRWKNKFIQDGDEIWYWEHITLCGGYGGRALVRNGDIIDTITTTYIN